MDALPLRPLRLRPEMGVPLRWAMLVWLAMLTSFAQFRLRATSELFERSGMDFQVKIQIVVWVALGVLALYLIRTGHTNLRLLKSAPLFWYAVYVAWALCSALWSPSPPLSAFRAGQLGVALLLVLSLGARLRDVYIFVAVSLCVNWLLLFLGIMGLNFGQSWILSPGKAYLMHGESPENPWRLCTAFGHPTQLGIMAAVAAVGLLARTRRGDWMKYGPWIAFFAATAVATVSRTCIAGMALGMLVVLLARRDLWPAALASAAVVLLLLPAFGEGAVKFLRRGQSSAELKSLTGRDQIFSEGLKRAERGGFVGLGFQCNRVASKDAGPGGLQVAHLHNAFLESYASLGIPGLALAIMIVLSLLRAIARLVWRCYHGACADNLAGWELAGMAVPILVYCLTDSGFAVSPCQYVMLFLVLMVRVTTLCATPAEEIYELRGVLHRSLPAASATPAGAVNPSA